MQIIKQDFKNGTVRFKVTDQDDLWYLSNIVEPEDLVRGTATRKIRIGDGENAKVAKKKITLTIRAEKIEYVPENEVTRVNGTIIEGPDDIPKGSYQNISLEEGNDYILTKTKWLSYHKDKLKEASNIKFKYLFCLFDRDEAMFAISLRSGYRILTRIKSNMPKKAYSNTQESNFYLEILKMIETYSGQHKPERIILAAPSFYKDEPTKLIKDQDLKKIITTVSCSSVSSPALEEVMRSPELNSILQNSRSRFEGVIVEELMQEIGKEGAYSYGFEEVKKAAEIGAVTKLLITDRLVTKLREKNDYTKLDNIMKLVDNLKGEIHIISSENDAGKKLDGLGGIGATLRYKL